MKKLSIFISIILVVSMLFPSAFLANNQEPEPAESIDISGIGSEPIENLDKPGSGDGDEPELSEHQGPKIEEVTDNDQFVKESESSPAKEEYNELGIKKGTEVFGVDISKLSEEELQYVPEGWRDGVVESEHPEEAPSKRMMSMARAAYPNVNNYILKGKYKTAKVKYSYKGFPKFSYRYSKPEGVVAHETANNSSTITGEINYMTRNYKNAFVHAFVDGSNIIEIHPTNHGAWGAGYYGNQRFIHVELVRVHSFEEFAKSINNYSSYIASLLYKYNLGVSRAKSNKTGTLWSHRDVSNILGGTNHGDPHGYFAKWGYNMEEFVKLVNIKYKELEVGQVQAVSKLGHLKANVKVYPDLSNQSKYFNGNNYTHAVYYIKKQKKIKGVTYYLISNKYKDQKGIGWVRAQDMTVKEHTGINKNKETMIVTGSGKSYNMAWGGAKNVVIKDMSPYIGENFIVNLTEKVGKTVWYRGTLNGKTMWLHSSYLTRITPTSQLGHIRDSNVEIYAEIGNEKTGERAGNTYTNQVYYIKQQVQINGQRYYLLRRTINDKGVIGWVKSQDMSIREHRTLDKKNKYFYIKGTGSAYNRAWGGKKDLVYKELAKEKGQLFTVNLTEKVGSSTWYRGDLNGKRVWIHSSYLDTVQQSKTSRLGHVNSSSVKIYRDLKNLNNASVAGSKYTHQVYYIKSQAKAYGSLYYLISLSPSSSRNVVGWVKSTELNSYPHKALDKRPKVLKIKGTGSSYNKAWGGKKNIVHKNLRPYKDKALKVNLTETVGRNIWYRGTLDNKLVWVHSSNVYK